MRASRLNQLAHLGPLVAGEIVHDYEGLRRTVPRAGAAVWRRLDQSVQVARRATVIGPAASRLCQAGWELEGTAVWR
jgi:hypothetical protein